LATLIGNANKETNFKNYGHIPVFPLYLQYWATNISKVRKIENMSNKIFKINFPENTNKLKTVIGC